MIPRTATIPMAVSIDRAPDAAARLAIVCLPGRGDRMDVYAQRGFIDAVRAAGIRADFYQVDAHLGYYINETLAVRMQEDVYNQLAGNYDAVWVVGTSLGALGAVLLEAERPGTWQRMLLLGPFVGDDAGFFAASGLIDGRPQRLPDDLAPEHLRRFWDWLIARANSDAPQPEIYATWGSNDRFAPYQTLLRAVLPEAAIHVVPGAHDWNTWQAGWTEWLRTVALEMD